MLYIRTWGHVLILKPHFCVDLMSLRVSVNATCEVFLKCFRLIFLPLKVDLIWVQTLTPRSLEIFFICPSLGLEAHFLDDLFKAGTNVSKNLKDK
jgi:hypothetical protein